jgi:hypothetical protein
MRSHKKKTAKFRSAKVGDSIKFNMACETDDCILDGTIIEIRGNVIEIQIDESSCGWGGCKECLNQSNKVNKKYTDVIF